MAHRCGRWHFEPRKLIALDKLWWPGNVQVDLHASCSKIPRHTLSFVVQHPRLVIIQAEADGDFDTFADTLHKRHPGWSIAASQAPAEALASSIDKIDHVLIFSGNIGYQGGSTADLSLLESKIPTRA